MKNIIMLCILVVLYGVTYHQFKTCWGSPCTLTDLMYFNSIEEVNEFIETKDEKVDGIRVFKLEEVELKEKLFIEEKKETIK